MTNTWFDIQFVLDRFASAIADVIGSSIEDGRIVRDVFGRLSFAPPPNVKEEQLGYIKTNMPGEIAPFVSSPNFLLNQKTPLIKSILKERGIIFRIKDSGQKYIVIDRRLAGEDWLQQPLIDSPVPPRFAFFGLKGGVGRSTTLERVMNL